MRSTVGRGRPSVRFTAPSCASVTAAAGGCSRNHCISASADVRLEERQLTLALLSKRRHQSEAYSYSAWADAEGVTTAGQEMAGSSIRESRVRERWNRRGSEKSRSRGGGQLKSVIAPTASVALESPIVKPSARKVEPISIAHRASPVAQSEGWD